MKNQTCCFTGHREIPPEEVPTLRGALLETVEGLVRQGVLYYGTGGARGFGNARGAGCSTPETEIPLHPADTRSALPYPDKGMAPAGGPPIRSHPPEGR